MAAPYYDGQEVYDSDSDVSRYLNSPVITFAAPDGMPVDPRAPEPRGRQQLMTPPAGGMLASEAIFELPGVHEDPDVQLGHLDSSMLEAPREPQAAAPPAAGILPVILESSDANHSGNSGGRKRRAKPVRSSLAIKKERTSKMAMHDLAEYLHLPMRKAAEELAISSAALKSICRRNGVYRWPGRQIGALNSKINELKEEARDIKRDGGLLRIMEEMRKIEADKAKIYHEILKPRPPEDDSNGGAHPAGN